jgi:hypothetical protein
LSTPKHPLTLETLQANLRRLAERLDFEADDDDSYSDTLDMDCVSSMLYDLANGVSGDVIADNMEFPTESPDRDEEE